MNISLSNRKDKRFVADINDKKIHFGAKYGETYIDHKDKIKRENYIKRHSALGEDWTKVNAGSLSRYILWGDSSNINRNITDYKKKFEI